MNKNFEDELAKAKRLMNAINPSKPSNSYNAGIVEYHTEGADGKMYGIVREGTSYYIKSALPKESGQLIAEDYDYIDGFMNKKQYEYNSYAKASKNLELKLRSIRESVSSKKPGTIEFYDPFKKMDIKIEDTKAIQEEIKRQKQISYNVGLILNESSGIDPKNIGVPEAPKKSQGSPASQGKPYENQTKANLDKDSIKSSSNHKKAAPFDQDGEVSDKDMQSDKNPKGNDGDGLENAKYTPKNAVVDKKPKGGKVAKVNEGENLAWNDNENYMDTSTETSIGDSAPFDKTVCKGKDCSKSEKSDDYIEEDATFFNSQDTISTPTPGEGPVGDSDPFNEEKNCDEGCDKNVKEEGCCGKCGKKLKEGEEGSCSKCKEKEVNEELADDLATNYTNYAGFDNEYTDDDLEFEKEWNAWLNGEDGENQEDDFAQDPSLDDDMPTRMDFDPTYGFDNPYESKKPKGKPIKEDKLDVFGKTPGYRKEPMTLPPNTEVAPNGARDWNDKSVANSEPFGQQIGSSAPFDQLVQKITDAVITALENKGKKKI